MFALEDEEISSGRIALYCWRNPGAAFSSVSVLPIDAEATTWAFKDDFPYLVVDRWTIVDVGTTNAPSKWSVQAGPLTQASEIAGAEPRQGTYAVAAAGARDWTDYRVTAGLLSSTDGTIGIAARYRNPDNHYRFEIDLESEGRRLVKVVAGEETTVWSDANGFKKDDAFVATLECVGTRLSCYVNGVKACDVIDEALASGRIALFTAGNAGASFDFVRVQEAAWIQYHRFPSVPTLPAGQRIRVLACSPEDAPPPIPNVRDEFAAGPGERGRLHFFDTGCDLRIVDPRGNAQHTRTIVRADRYAPLPEVKVLQRRDGCGFFVVTSDAAEHRLAFTYRRNNTALDPESIVSREAGDASPETVVLDVP